MEVAALYNFEYDDDDNLARIRFDNGKEVVIRFVNNTIEITPKAGVMLQTDELPGKLLIDVS